MHNKCKYVQLMTSRIRKQANITLVPIKVKQMKIYNLQVEKSAGMTGIPNISGYGSYFLICEIISVIVLRRASRADEFPNPPTGAELMLRIIGKPPCTCTFLTRGVLGFVAGSADECVSSLCTPVSLEASKFSDPRINDLLLRGAEPVRPIFEFDSDGSISRAV